MTESTSESEDRATELASGLEEVTDRIIPLLDDERELSSEDEEAVGDALAEFGEVAREAGFEDVLRTAGFEDLPDDPAPADLPALVGRADEEEVDTVHRLLGLRDLADDWEDLESDERLERLRDLFDSTMAESEVSEGVKSADESSAAESEGTDTAEETGDGAEAEDDERSEGVATSFVDRLRETADQLSETAAESAADETERTAEAAGEDEEGEEAEAEPDDESDRGTSTRRGRYSSLPSNRPDMRGVGHQSTMPRRRKRD